MSNNKMSVRTLAMNILDDINKLYNDVSKFEEKTGFIVFRDDVFNTNTKLTDRVKSAFSKFEEEQEWIKTQTGTTALTTEKEAGR